jgi:hypothetical protein
MAVSAPTLVSLDTLNAIWQNKYKCSFAGTKISNVPPAQHIGNEQVYISYPGFRLPD